MRQTVVILLTVALISSADEPKVAVKDKEALQGLWQAVQLEANGKKAPDEAVTAFQIQIDANHLVFNPATDNRKHTYVIDSDAKPKSIDLTPAGGPEKGKQLPCAIYKLEDDTLTICIDKEGKAGKRPTEFRTTAGDGFSLFTLEKLKVSDIMLKAHLKPQNRATRNNLDSKVIDGKATDAEQKELLMLYTALSKLKPPRGEIGEWKTRTDEVVDAVKAVIAKEDKASERLTKARDCKSCHDKHREN
jgi:uncharacterized protein (TIGR03067 family)